MCQRRSWPPIFREVSGMKKSIKNTPSDTGDIRQGVFGKQVYHENKVILSDFSRLCKRRIGFFESVIKN